MVGDRHPLREEIELMIDGMHRVFEETLDELTVDMIGWYLFEEWLKMIDTNISDMLCIHRLSYRDDQVIVDTISVLVWQWESLIGIDEAFSKCMGFHRAEKKRVIKSIWTEMN